MHLHYRDGLIDTYFTPEDYRIMVTVSIIVIISNTCIIHTIKQITIPKQKIMYTYLCKNDIT